MEEEREGGGGCDEQVGWRVEGGGGVCDDEQVGWRRGEGGVINR